MPKRKFETQVVSVFRLDDICRRVGAGEAISDDEVNYVIQLAADNGIPVEEGGGDLGRLCSTLIAEINDSLGFAVEMTVMEMPYPEARFVSHFTPRRTVKPGIRPNYGGNLPLDVATQEEPSALQNMPIEIQMLIWLQYLGENSTLPAMYQRIALLGPISKTQTLILRSVLERIAQTARPWPTTYKIRVGDPRWFVKGGAFSKSSAPAEHDLCKELGFLQTDCKLTVPADLKWPNFEANYGYEEVINADYYYRIAQHVAWSCPCVSVQIPVSLDLGWYVTVPAYSAKGYFTVDDLLRMVGDYLLTDFNEEDLAVLKEMTGEPSLEVEEKFNHLFYPYKPNAYVEFLNGDLTRSAGLYYAHFGGFEEIHGEDGNYLRTLWTEYQPNPIL